MTTLTIDTATSIASVGLVLADGRCICAEPIRAANAAQHVLSAVDAVLLNDVCHALDKRMSLVMPHWGVL